MFIKQTLLLLSSALLSLSLLANDISILDYGAIPNDGMDDTAAIQAAFFAAAANTSVDDPEALPVSVYFPEGSFNTANVVYSDTPISISSSPASELVCQGNGIMIGYSGDVYGMEIVLPNIRKAYLDWGSTNFGFKGVNIRNSRITTRKISGFQKGFVAEGNVRGFVYNDVFVGRLTNNKYNLYFNSLNSGWVNENTWYGGKYEYASGAPVPVGSAWHIYIPAIDNQSLNGHNRNVFIRPTLEGQNSTVIKVEVGGNENLFISPRLEDAGLADGTFVFTDKSRANVVQYPELSASDEVFDDQGTGNLILGNTGDAAGKSWSTNGAVISAANLRGDGRVAVGASKVGEFGEVEIGLTGSGTILWPTRSKRMYLSGDYFTISGGSRNFYWSNGLKFQPIAPSQAQGNVIFVDTDGKLKFKNGSGVVQVISVQ